MPLLQIPRMHRHLVLVPLLVSLFALPSQAAPPTKGKLQFNRDIQPILADKCFHCHGPDKKNRKGDLRLDTKAGLFGKRDDGRVVVAGKVKQSMLVKRVFATDDEQMPPADAPQKLTKQEKETLRRWIQQGAPWQGHWSFIPPQRPSFPVTKNRNWAQTAIDRFVLAKLEQAKFQPNKRANKTTLIRRVTLDLTGLPATPRDVRAFLRDKSPQAYEKVVDRLLKSRHYAERMAMHWLDAARFADTSGYQTDGVRYMWRWRDWVIDAFDENMPFDQFTIEQLAGDLLPDPSLEQRIATGFNRNHRANSEGGIIFEEYLVEYAVDRVDTTFTVWLGLTMGCARCHEHKYDPITQKEFYQVMAYFNNIPERGRVIKYGNSAPFIKAPTRLMQRKLRQVKREMLVAHRLLDANEDRIQTAQLNWEAKLDTNKPLDFAIQTSLKSRYTFDGKATDSLNPKKKIKIIGKPTYKSGRVGLAGVFDGKSHVADDKAYAFKGDDELSFTAWIYPKRVDQGTVVAHITDDDSRNKGFSIHFDQGKLAVNFGPRWLDDAFRVATVEKLKADRWYHIAVLYDGSQRAAGVKVLIDGKPRKTKTRLDMFTGSVTVAVPRLIGSRGKTNHFVGLIDDVRFYLRKLPAKDVAIIACHDTINQIVSTPSEKRTQQQRTKLRRFFLEHPAPKAIKPLFANLQKTRQARLRLLKSMPTTMVMQELTKVRPTHLLIRGEYNKLGERVKRGVPKIFPQPPAKYPKNRLGFAKWLVNGKNPLTGRVIVNRFWSMYFGQGLVRTMEDFGTQGARPTHPELLDWLATDFVKSGWDVKRLQKMIVMSATYRQSSHLTKEKLKRDPENRLLARTTRLRLPAEMIRDQALAASGLLVRRIGGPSVKPYQPDGLWKEIASDTYTQDHGDKLYRRSMYTFWKRTVPPPTMTTFDAGSRETCVVWRSRTNTPLQALALLNDVTYVEAARRLGERMMTEGGKTPAERIDYGFRLVVARRPTSLQGRILLAAYKRSLARYTKEKDAAAKLVRVGESKANQKLSVVELASYTTIGNILLNMDETVNRE